MSIEKLKYSSYGKTIDGTNYCSAVETLAENLIEDNEDDAVVVFPSRDGWASLRTSEYTMTTENVEAIVPIPIYKIKKFLLKVPKDISVYIYQGGDAGDKLVSIGETTEFDITAFLVTPEEWGGLGISTAYIDGKYKDNTLVWEENSDSVQFISTSYNFLERRGILGTSIATRTNNLPVYFRMLQSVIKQTYSGPAGTHPAFSVGYKIGECDVRNWLFRIEYVPATEKTKIRARKNAHTTVDYIQPYNQRAEINAVSALGQNMYLTAQKTGVREIKIVKNYTRLADIPPLGALVRHNGKRYRLVANTYNQTNTFFIQVTHTLSENWTSRSKHVAVDQKYRNWKIPQDILWRNLYWEDFVLISPELDVGVMYQKEDAKASVPLSYIMQGLKIDHSDDSTVDTLFFIQGGYGDLLTGVCAPCSTMVVGNSLVFAGQMKDNLSAGIRHKPKDFHLCEETLYCNPNGTLENMCVILSEGFKSGVFNCINGSTTDAVASEATGTTHAETVEGVGINVYPTVSQLVLQDSEEKLYLYTTNAPKTVLMHKNFHVDKDPGEAFKFTYQIHFIANGGIIVGSKLAEHNPLIKHWEKNRQFRLWGLKAPIGEGADVFIPRDDEPSWEKLNDDTDGNTFTVADRTQGLDGKEVFELTINNELTDCVGWCITDEKNNIYLACNDRNIKKLYFQMTHKREKKY